MTGSPRVPVSTYRLQVHAGFPLTAAAAVVPYLDALGVSDAYTSPLLAAREASVHGYDGINPEQVSPDLGGVPALDALSAALRERGMGLLVDIVPNHLAAVPDNAWWADVLAHGPASKYAGYFDIDFDTPPRPSDRGRVVLPCLGSPYADALAAGSVKLSADAEGVWVQVYDRRLPIDPRTLPLIGLDLIAPGGLGEAVQTAGGLPPRTAPDAAAAHETALGVNRHLAATLAGNADALAEVRRHVADINADPARLDAVLSAQPYRVCHWRAGADEVNYRRFFDVADLVALRADRGPVFVATHALTLKWLTTGRATGVRIDHPDGLADPAGYLDRLQATYRDAAGPDAGPLYVVVEKILARGEPVRPEWATAGATGYEFIAAVNPLFVDPAAEAAMTDVYHAFTGQTQSFGDMVVECKQLVLDTSFGGDLDRVADLLMAVAAVGRASRDFTRGELRRAVRAVVAAFPVYRTYVTDALDDADRAVLDQAASAATRRLPTHAAAVEFCRATLALAPPPAGDIPPAGQADYRAAQIRFAGRFQQLTAPATAKGFEDTALYRYARLISLNEVGGDPARFGCDPAEVHAFFRDRPRGALSPLSTHDTKRGEDARARINVLSEMPRAWGDAVGRWAALNRRHKTTLPDGRPAPDANDEYLLYQTLVGVWPGAADATLAGRVQEFAVKALHEAKRQSSWRDPDAAYDAATCAFLAAILDPSTGAEFLADFAAFHAPVARHGAVNSLAQTLVRCTAPGVPDTYQGSEFWDFSLVDPDNRRPVDYAARTAALAELDAGDAAHLARELAADPTDARAKLFVVSQALRFRRERAALFAAGGYVPLTVTGPRAEQVFAYLRECDGEAALVVVPRLGFGSGGEAWARTFVELPAAYSGRRWVDAFTGVEVSSDGGRLGVGAVWSGFAVGLLGAVL